MPSRSAEKRSRVGLSGGLSFPIYRDRMKSFSTHTLLVILARSTSQEDREPRRLGPGPGALKGTQALKVLQPSQASDTWRGGQARVP